MKPKYIVIAVLLALAATVSVLYYIRQPGLDLGPIVIHHQQPKPVSPVATTTVASIQNWKTYTNSQYRFEFRYPDGWPVTDSISKDKLVVVGDSAGADNPANYPKCYLSFDFNNPDAPAPHTYNYYNQINEGESCDSTLQQIAASFKFTADQSATDTTGWKTYTNSQYRFSFKYPEGLTYKEHLTKFDNFDNFDVEFNGNGDKAGYTFGFSMNDQTGIEGYDIISEKDQIFNGVKMHKEVFGDSDTKAQAFVLYEFSRDSDEFIFSFNPDKISELSINDVVASFKFAKLLND